MRGKEKARRHAYVFFMILVWTMAAAAVSPASSRAQQPASAPVCPTWQQQYEQLIHPAIGGRVITARHRGSFDESIPENSLGAFAQAFQECRPAVETDVRMTSDKKLVVFHDVRVGKMLEPSYDPESDTGPNPRLDSLTFDQVRRKRLVKPDRTPTHYLVPTVEELIQLIIDSDANSLVHLEIKESEALIPTLRVIADKARLYPGAEVPKRVVVKFAMNDAPTPEHMRNLLEREGLPQDFLFMLKVDPGIAAKLNELPDIPQPPELELSTNASRAVANWAAADHTHAPVIEVNIKDSTEFRRTEKDAGSRFGAYERPVNLALDNVKKGTIAEFVALVHFYGARLGAFVPVPDYVMFTPGPAAGFTVPNTYGTKEPIVATEAFFNNTSSCCYRLADRRASSPVAAERHDWRDNLDFLHSIGATVLTADDTDSIDIYAYEQGYLNQAARPEHTAPKANMNSSLYYAIRERAVPDRALVNIQGWDGGESSAWGGKVCWWSDPGKFLWTAKCSLPHTEYSDELQIETVSRGPGSAKMRIRDPKSLQCVYSDPHSEDRVYWSPRCDDPRALFTRSPQRRFLDADGREINFQWDDRYTMGVPYAYNFFSRKDRSTWSQWKLVPAPSAPDSRSTTVTP
ncbi:glycerophosphodiester phosphodiesterase family protein [Corynebacterium liangguodongii]|uniref:Uncharacterized protein n=1 Tax=Corynebacterium liangguodongii TaxID=2079535 RepID=A0A2S0WBR1_9CORY|nr:glycerophosphodiester phosphodiesterase family protein [Corynebacterium liangguodongii]AWB83206.1 hypothetical protein C3E79_00840 [Corynebacterium liangguodongii]PWB98801.1 hypothetical protein DF219_10300 [Corynebacterium liangguodongii]